MTPIWGNSSGGVNDNGGLPTGRKTNPLVAGISSYKRSPTPILPHKTPHTSPAFLCFCSPSLTQAIVDSLAIDCGLLTSDSPLGLRKHKICSATAV